MPAQPRFVNHPYDRDTVCDCQLQITMPGKKTIEMTAEDRKIITRHYEVSFQILKPGSLWIQDWSELLATGVENQKACSLGKHNHGQACLSHHLAENRTVSQAPAFNFRVLMSGKKLFICLLQT